ncbi:DUF5590 domain-containing protein [Paenibacillus sp. sgz500958]|uniref:cell wall elongation regulator TseB-like domain-containing protein n=1 Tax=Paenibacillus sp. sgz500958 TaxID=3242475 RepID=UPI0036D3930D
MRKRRKWILLGFGVALLLLFVLSRFYAFIMDDQWEEQSLAMKAAYSLTDLTEVDKVQKSVWDENSIFWVLTGKDKAGTGMMVWVRFTVDGKVAEGNGAVYGMPVSSGTSEKKIRSIIAQDLPGISIERLLPGAYNGEYAWQLFYKKGGRYYYRFYRFSDGTSIGDGYKLPNR